MATISVDLAYRNYRDFGVAVMDRRNGGVSAEFIGMPLAGEREPERLADYLLDLCATRGAQTLLLDGPQAWKDPSNGLAHSRRCERELNTPAKTGLPGAVKPGNYKPFVSFSIAVYDALAARGWSRLSNDAQWGNRIVVESFPLSAWRSLRDSCAGLEGKDNGCWVESARRIALPHVWIAIESRAEPRPIAGCGGWHCWHGAGER